jgi:hypothetical protein
MFEDASTCNRPRVVLVAVGLATFGLLAPRSGRAADGAEPSEAEASAARDATKSGRIWSGVRQLADHDTQSHTLEAASGVVAGTILTGYGVYEYTSSETYIGSEVVSWAFVLSGATALGSALYQSTSTHAGVDYAETLLSDESISDRAARAYLRYRSRRARQRRIMGGVGTLAAGVASGGMLAVFALTEDETTLDESIQDARAAGRVAIGVSSVALVAGGVLSLALRSTEEKIYRSATRSNGDDSTASNSSGTDVAVAPALFGDPERDETMFGARLKLDW